MGEPIGPAMSWSPLHQNRDWNLCPVALRRSPNAVGPRPIATKTTRRCSAAANVFAMLYWTASMDEFMRSASSGRDQCWNVPKGLLGAFETVQVDLPMLAQLRSITVRSRSARYDSRGARGRLCYWNRCVEEYYNLSENKEAVFRLYV
jgi:hypothetical protein